MIIQTDDQTVADLASMPRTQALIADRGVTFANAIVPEPQCCPSRATLLTGRYPHNHHVLTTTPPFGGVDAFDPAEALPVWLQRAGYRTTLIGKYFNGYRAGVPPGWDSFAALPGPSLYSFATSTDDLTAQAEQSIRDRDPRAPQFLYLNYVAPHAAFPPPGLPPPAFPTTIASGLRTGTWAGVPLPRPPGFDEPDVSDKPRAVRRRPRLDAGMRAAIQTAWQRRQEALQDVDAGVERVVAALRAAGTLDRTLLVFLSDNGYMTGEHRIPYGKLVPYEPSIRVPLLLRGPGIPEGRTSKALVMNGDLAPTILAATGATAPWAFDGRSLWPLIEDTGRNPERTLLLEGPPVSRLDATPRYTGVRTRRHKYLEHVTGERELYDLHRDPAELDNLRGPSVTKRELTRRLGRLRHCAGATCQPAVPDVVHDVDAVRRHDLDHALRRRGARG